MANFKNWPNLERGVFQRLAYFKNWPNLESSIFKKYRHLVYDKIQSLPVPQLSETCRLKKRHNYWKPVLCLKRELNKIKVSPTRVNLTKLKFNGKLFRKRETELENFVETRELIENILYKKYI